MQTNLMNKQPADIDKKLPVVEIFGPTIQGEGHVAGLRTIFLRMGGCDYECSHCDSMHAVDPEQIKAHAQYLTQEEILERLLRECKNSNTPTITISGGNPAIHDLDFLTYELERNEIAVSVETQGTIWRRWLGHVPYLTISPKGPGMGIQTDFKVLDKFMEQVHFTSSHYRKRCMKIVIFSAADLEFASECVSRYKGFDDLDKLYLSIGNPHEKSLDLPIDQFRQLISSYTNNIIEDVRGFPALRNARLLPQVHTLLWGQEKGV